MEIKKIMQDFKERYIYELDNILMREIIGDIINGSLYVTADDKTVLMMLTSIWEDKETYEAAGVIVGDS